MAHDVFISYSAKDKAVADAVCASLEADHIRCYIAPRDVLPGQRYAQALVDAIHTSEVLVLVFSSASNSSDQVEREVDRAVSSGIPILPLRVEDVFPSRWLEYYLAGQHWLDALTPPLENHLERLSEAIGILLLPPTKREHSRLDGEWSGHGLQPTERPEAVTPPFIPAPPPSSGEAPPLVEPLEASTTAEAAELVEATKAEATIEALEPAQAAETETTVEAVKAAEVVGREAVPPSPGAVKPEDSTPPFIPAPPVAPPPSREAPPLVEPLEGPTKPEAAEVVEAARVDEAETTAEAAEAAEVPRTVEAVPPPGVGVSGAVTPEAVARPFIPAPPVAPPPAHTASTRPIKTVRPTANPGRRLALMGAAIVGATWIVVLVAVELLSR